MLSSSGATSGRYSANWMRAAVLQDAKDDGDEDSVDPRQELRQYLGSPLVRSDDLDLIQWWGVSYLI